MSVAGIALQSNAEYPRIPAACFLPEAAPAMLAQSGMTANQADMKAVG